MSLKLAVSFVFTAVTYIWRLLLFHTDQLLIIRAGSKTIMLVAFSADIRVAAAPAWETCISTVTAGPSMLAWIEGIRLFYLEMITDFF